MEETLSGLRLGLGLSVAAIFLLLAAAFQSVRLAFGVVLMLPAVLLGVLLALLLTHTTLNVPSFTGAIMAMGIAMANAILLVSFFAERSRLTGEAPLRRGCDRRPRSPACCVDDRDGDIVGHGSDRVRRSPGAPLGRAVIGGLMAATAATLFVLPAIYATLQSKASAGSVSLDPSDPESRW